MRGTTWVVGVCLVALFGCAEEQEPAGNAPAATQAGGSETSGAAGVAGTGAGASSQTPEEVAQAFMAAGNAGDEAAFLGLLTAKARESITSDPTYEMSEQTFDEYTIGNAAIAGDTAEVPIEATDEGETQQVSLKMRQESGAWRVFGVGMTLAEGMEFSIDFENIGEMLENMAESMGDAMGDAMGEAFSGLGSSEGTIEEQKASFEALRAVSQEEYEAGWRNTEDFRGKSGLETLNTLAAGLQLSIDTTGYEEALAKPVEAELAGLSRMEAIERVCAGAGLVPVFPDPDVELGLLGAMAEAMVDGLVGGGGRGDRRRGERGGGARCGDADAAKRAGITLAEGARQESVVFTGPLMVSVMDLQTNPPYPTGFVMVDIRGYGLDPTVLSLLSGNSDWTNLDTIEGPEGQSLLNEGNYYAGGGTVSRSIFVGGIQADLVGMVKSVSEISTIRGEQGIALPTSVEEVTLSEVAEGVTGQAGGVTVAVVSSSEGYTELKLTGPEEVLSRTSAKYWATDAEGSDLEILSQNYSKWAEGEADASVQTELPHTSLRVKLVSVAAPVVYPFELKDISVPDAASMPESVVELSFEGQEAPIAIEFVRMVMDDPDFPEVVLRVVNHSNKDAESAMISMVFLDESGNALDDFPNSLSGEFGDEGVLPLAKVGESAEVQATAFSAPEGTASVRAEIRLVEFMDGTAWEGESSY